MDRLFEYETLLTDYALSEIVKFADYGLQLAPERLLR